MQSVIRVAIHESQSPDNVRRGLLTSLRTRKVNHKFHYDSIKQTNKWLALHQVFSPSRSDAECAATYDRAFKQTVTLIKSRRVHLVGLGCGGGQKDTTLLRRLKTSGRSISYLPADVSVAMTLVATRTASTVVKPGACFPLVCDLANASDLERVIAAPQPGGSIRLLTFFGMIPNFEPQQILPKLAGLVRPGDTLLFSANLAPGADYAAGMKQILPQYDNQPTREWLLTFLLDLGVERKDGELRFQLEPGGKSLRRVVARFLFRRNVTVEVEGASFHFRRGENIRLFFSYRYTPKLVRHQLAKYGLKVVDQWITRSEEEGVFLCRRQ